MVVGAACCCQACKTFQQQVADLPLVCVHGTVVSVMHKRVLMSYSACARHYNCVQHQAAITVHAAPLQLRATPSSDTVHVHATTTAQ
jgi:uncharacterized protein (DUF1499 family)